MKISPVVRQNSVLAELDISDLPELKDNTEIKRYCFFSIDTYARLQHSTVTGAWEATFVPVNKFFETLDESTKTSIAIALLVAHRKILEYGRHSDGIDPTKAMNDIGQILVALNREVQLCNRIKQFAVGNLPLGNYDKAGSRPQDRPETTIYPHEGEDLLAITVLCKMLSPLFGVAMCVFVNSPGLDRELKEIYTAQLISPVLDDQYPEFMTKLMRILQRTIQNTFKQDTTAIFRGTTADSLLMSISASLYVRSLVNVDLYYKHGTGNLAIYVFATIKESIGARRNAGGPNRATFQHREPNDFGEMSDPQNVSQYEVDSVASSISLDTDAIVNSQIDVIIGRCLHHHDLDISVYMQMLAFYAKHHYTLTLLNRTIVFGFFGPHFSGAQTLQIVHADSFNKLIAFVQLLAFKATMPALGHLLTAKRSTTVKATMTEAEQFLDMNYMHTYDFNNCAGRFTAAGGRVWNDGVHAIITDIISHDWHFNTADIIWECAGETSRNNELIATPKALANELSAFVARYILDIQVQ